MNIPNTIKYPKTFKESPSAGFDGVFDWSWTDGCFGNKKITHLEDKLNNVMVSAEKIITDLSGRVVW